MVGEAFALINDVLDGAGALTTPGVGHNAESALHVAALHDADEFADAVLLVHVVTNRVLRVFLLLRIDNGATQIVHLGFLFSPHQVNDVRHDAMVFLGAGNEITGGRLVEQFFPAALGHTPHEAVDDIWILFPVFAEMVHPADGLLFGLIANRAGIH